MFLDPDKFQDKYPRGKMIGEGAYGSVYESGDFVVKSQSGFEKDYRLRGAIKEVNIFSMISHPCIIQLEDWTFENTKNELYISLPKGESIIKAIYYGRITMEKVQKDLFSAMNFLNKNGIAHCDLKPPNMVFFNGKACLIDFGLVQLANLYDEGYFINGIAYTETFRDPEYWDEDYNSIRAELYSVAQTLYMCAGQGKDPRWNPFDPSNYKTYDMRTGIDWLDDVIKRCSHFPLSERETYIDIDPSTREEGHLLDTPVVALDPKCNQILGMIFTWVMTVLVKLQFQAKTAFLTLHLIHRTLQLVFPNYTTETVPLEIYVLACVCLSGIIYNEKYLDYSDLLPFVKNKYNVTDLIRMIFYVLRKAQGIIYTPTYWDHANFAEDLIPLIKYTFICKYDPNRLPVKLASSGTNKDVDFAVIFNELNIERYSITENMKITPKTYYEPTEAKSINRVPKFDRDTSLFYLKDQSEHFNNVYIVGHFHEFLKDMKTFDAVRLYDKMRYDSYRELDNVIAYQVLEKIVGYKPEHVEFEALGLHPFRATWDEIEKARAESINKPLEAGLNPLRRAKKKWEIDEEKVDYQVIDGVLDLSQKNLKEIPEEIFDLVDITTLNLFGNQITTLPSAIGKLVNLEELWVSHNQLTSLPPDIGKLVNLEKLYVFDNQLTSLPSEIGKLVNLKELVVSYNQLTSLPSEIGKLVNLEELDVYNNQLTSLPSEMGQLINLKQFTFDDNPLEYIPPEVRELFNQMGIDVPF
jgi:serine/threonine protein kinase